MDAIALNVEGRKFIMAAAFQGIGFRLLSFGTLKYILIWTQVGPRSWSVWDSRLLGYFKHPDWATCFGLSQWGKAIVI